MRNKIANYLKPKHAKKILISFCNLEKPRKSSLLLYDIAKAKKKWVQMGLRVPVASCTGLCMSDEYIFCLFLLLNKGFFVTVLTKNNLRPIFFQHLKEVQDGHSICMHKGRLLVVSTGTDEVISYELSKNTFRNPDIFWKSSNARTDTHHLNSILNINDEVYISGFGPKKGLLWSSADDGYIYNITTMQMVKRGIYHPHTLFSSKNTLFYCESSLGELRSVDAKHRFKANGYARGASFVDNNTVVVGTSIGRKQSKSTGLINNPADPGQNAGKCGITFYDIENNIYDEVDLSTYANEIYDIVPIN